MKINDAGLIFAYELLPLRSAEYIVLHHAAGHGDVKSVHSYHRYANGWAGIAYHLYVRQDGTVWRGRPMDTQGGHCRGYNSRSIGICFEGNFNNEKMGEEQLEAGREAIRYARSIYPDAAIVGHRELCPTSCPGKYFPLAELKGDGGMTGREIYEKLQAYFDEQPVPGWAQEELERAKALGITDGEAPMQLIPRYQAAIMAMRAAEKEK